MNHFPPKPAKARPSRVQQGVVLLESLIAILIFSFGILGIVGLQAAMIKNTSDAKYRADASYIAQQKIGTLWADPDTARVGWVIPAEDETDISNLLPNGKRSVVMSAAGEFTITITWQQPGSDEVHNFTTTAHIDGG